MTNGDLGRVGPWLLGEQLGKGGNGVVHRATHAENDQTVALKLIKVKKAAAEPYRRFVREIDFLRVHGEVEGILPLLDAYLPESPSGTDVPWLAMPIAVPVREALGGQPLDIAVEVVAAVADTLWRLERDTGIAHRDVKPGNLYQMDGRWLLGDFGLISVPGTEGLTEPGARIGPAHFIAYEMITDPVGADPHAADVYSLGKTLWVLATEQTWPPLGHQPVSTPGYAIGDLVPHPKAKLLDQEIDSMTRIDPAARPSKEQVARDLAKWIDLSDPAPELDISAAKIRLNKRIAGDIARQDLAAERKDAALEAVRRVQELTKPLNDKLKELSPRTVIDSSTDKLTNNMLSIQGWGSSVEFEWKRATLVAPVDNHLPWTLRMGRAIHLLETGELVFDATITVRTEGVMGGGAYNWRQELGRAPVGTVEQEDMLIAGVRIIREKLAEAVEAFVDGFPEPTG